MTSDPAAEPRKRGPTVKDVAARAAVSIGTVSHVISGRRNVAPERRQRVERAMAELGFRPNRIARSLILHHTNTIAMVIPDVANPFFGELMRGAEDVARSAGYCVLFGNTDNSPAEEERYLLEFTERQIDGLLMVDAIGDRAALGRSLGSVPIVALDRVPEMWEHDAVVVDNRQGVDSVVSHLVAFGHRRLGYIGGDPLQSTGRERRQGMDESLARRGLEPAWMSEGAFSLESGQAQVHELFALPRAAWPTAIVAGNDLIALGVLAAARQEGVHVPGDMSVVGFDDITYAALAVPALTSVRQPAREIGAHAARMLLERIAGRMHASETRLIRTTLVVRESTGPAPC